MLRPYALRLMALVLTVLNEDNEENGLLCLRICFDLHRNYRPALEEQIGPFLAFVQKARPFSALVLLTGLICSLTEQHASKYYKQPIPHS